MDADHLSKCVCGKRRLCVRCITVAGADRSETAQEKGDEASEGEQAAVQDGDEVSEGEQDHREDGLDEASEDEQLEDITDEPHWTAIRRCKWGYHPWCGHNSHFRIQINNLFSPQGSGSISRRNISKGTWQTLKGNGLVYGTTAHSSLQIRPALPYT